MKKIFCITILFLNISCVLPNYLFENKAQTTGVDFTNGKWILNRIEAPSSVSDELEKSAKKDFSKYLSNRLFNIVDVKNVLIKSKIEFNPSKNTLLDIKKGCNFDYFINIKAANIKTEYGSIDISPSRFKKQLQNQCYVIIEVYDLNLSEIIYSQKVVATVQSPNDNSNVHFSRTQNSLIFSAYRKIIKNINKNSIIQKK